MMGIYLNSIRFTILSKRECGKKPVIIKQCPYSERNKAMLTNLKF